MNEKISPTVDNRVDVPLVEQASARVVYKAGVGYTVLVIFLTVIGTIIAEIIIGFALASYLFNSWWKEAKKDWSGITTTQTTAVGSKTSGGSKTNALTKEQKDLLGSFGIKAEDLPAGIDAQKISCAQTAIGTDRIKAIITGSQTPSLSDILRVRTCL